MKKHHYIYFILLCLIATSCENTVLEEEVPAASAITRNSNEYLSYYGTNFYDLTYFNDEVSAYISTNAIGAEYTLRFLTLTDTPNGKSVVTIIGGNIIYNGRNVGSQISGGHGEMVGFTFKFTSTTAKVTVTLEGAGSGNKSKSVRLVIDQRKYNGVELSLPTPDVSYCDLVLGQLP